MMLQGKVRRFSLTATILILASAGLAYAQLGGSPAQPVKGAGAGAVYEFTHQEVQAAAVVATLNDLSKQGWEVFQIIPAWTIKNEDGATELTPKLYEVFAKKPAASK
jgi:hypothetical protein